MKTIIFFLVASALSIAACNKSSSNGSSPKLSPEDRNIIGTDYDGFVYNLEGDCKKPSTFRQFHYVSADAQFPVHLGWTDEQKPAEIVAILDDLKLLKTGKYSAEYKEGDHFTYDRGISSMNLTLQKKLTANWWVSGGKLYLENLGVADEISTGDVGVSRMRFKFTSSVSDRRVLDEYMYFDSHWIGEHDDSFQHRVASYCKLR